MLFIKLAVATTIEKGTQMCFCLFVLFCFMGENMQELQAECQIERK